MSERDFEEARRGFVAPFDPPLVEDERGRTVWDLRPYPAFPIVTPRP